MGVLERYSQAVNSDDLTVDERTTWSDTDVLGAMGFAGAEGFRAGRGGDLGAALARLFADSKPEPALSILAEMAYGRSHHMRLKIAKVEAQDLAKAVLAHYRYGTCLPCGGTGYSVIPGTPIHGEECQHCGGSGKTPFDPQFRSDRVDLARWLGTQIDRALAVAGSAAMAMLAPRLDL